MSEEEPYSKIFYPYPDGVPPTTGLLSMSEDYLSEDHFTWEDGKWVKTTRTNPDNLEETL